jgi:hypothetical protein
MIAPRQVYLRDSPELGIHHRYQAAESFLVALGPGRQ